jgi:histidine triad (HIT) family protein
MSSIFTRIINREIPSTVVYEDDICIAILDISPRTSGHTLLIPKSEVANFWDLEQDTWTHLCIQAQEVSKILIEKLGCERIQLEIV